MATRTIASATTAGSPPFVLPFVTKKSFTQAWSAAYGLAGSTAPQLFEEISVAKKPGSMQATRMPKGASSQARLWLSAPRACLLAA